MKGIDFYLVIFQLLFIVLFVCLVVCFCLIFDFFFLCNLAWSVLIFVCSFFSPSSSENISVEGGHLSSINCLELQQHPDV